jgi:hypothetical protein
MAWCLTLLHAVFGNPRPGLLETLCIKVAVIDFKNFVACSLCQTRMNRIAGWLGGHYYIYIIYRSKIWKVFYSFSRTM